MPKDKSAAGRKTVQGKPEGWKLFRRTRKNVYRKSSSRNKWALSSSARVGIAVALLASSAALLALALIFSYDFLTQCSYFNGKQIQVEGVNRLTRGEVLLLAGIRPGMNVLSVNLPLTRKSLIGHPWIADAEVRREIPSGVQIRIREEVPMAILQLDRPYVVNTRGRIFKQWAEEDRLDLPQIDGLDFADLNSEGNPSGKTFAAVMELIRIHRENGGILAGTEIEKIHADREIGLTVYLKNHPRAVRLGFGRYTDKVHLLQRVQLHLDQNPGLRDIQSIDMNNPERIVISPLADTTSESDRKEV